MGHWKAEPSAAALFHNLGLINPNLVDSHAVFSLFGTGRRGWQRKLLLRGPLQGAKKRAATNPKDEPTGHPHLSRHIDERICDLQAQLLRSTLDAYTEMLQLTVDRRKGGLASDSDVEEAKAQLEETRAQLIDLGVQRAQYEHAIAVLVGAPATGFHLAEQPLAGDPPAIPTGIPSQLLERRPDIAAAERRVAAANALIGVAKSAFYPTVTLGASGGTNSDLASQVFSPNSTEWYAGPSISETIFDAGRRKAQVDFARSQREEAAAEYREQVLSAFRDVEDQLAALRVLEDEATVTARAVDAAKKSTALSTFRYKRGLAAYLEVLTNQTIELNDERAAAALVSRRIVASTQLQMALGGGWSSAQLPKN